MSPTASLSTRLYVCPQESLNACKLIFQTFPRMSFNSFFRQFYIFFMYIFFTAVAILSNRRLAEGSSQSEALNFFHFSSLFSAFLAFLLPLPLFFSVFRFSSPSSTFLLHFLLHLLLLHLPLFFSIFHFFFSRVLLDKVRIRAGGSMTFHRQIENASSWTSYDVI